MDLDNWKKHCSSCSILIQNVLVICRDCEVKLCLQCFISQVIIGRHTSEHYVYMMDLGTFPIFKHHKLDSKNEEEMQTSLGDDDEEKDAESEYEKIALDTKNLDEFIENFADTIPQACKFPGYDLGEDESKEDKHEWTALDELALIEAILRHGFGNWKGISKAVSANCKVQISPQEAEAHYNRHYINGIVGKLTWLWASLDPNIQQLSNFPRGTNVFEDLDNNVPINEKFIDIPQSELDALGYLPKRDDYEKEFDNDAEALIANLFIGAPDEDELERKFKFAQVDMYQRRLIQRFRKKAIVKENDLLTQFYKHVIVKSESKDSSVDIDSEKNLHASFMRFCKLIDANCLITDLLKEYYLKIFLKRFVKYYYAGLNTGEEIKAFEEKIKRRNTLKRYLVDEAKSEPKLKKQKKDKRRKTKDTPSTSRDVEEIEEEEEDLFAMMFDEEDDFDREILKYLITEEPVISLFEITKKIVDEINSDETKEFLEKSSDLVDQLEGEENDSLVPTSKQIELRSSIARKAAKGFKVEGLKGSNLLSESEKKLCTELKLSPMDYIKYKTLIIKHWSEKSPKSSQIENDTDLFTSPKLAKFFDLNPENENIIRKVSKYLESIGIGNKK